MGVVSLSQPSSGQAVRSLDGLRALVLLGGSVWTGRLGSLTGRPIFDLPLEASCSILDLWRREAMTLASLIGLAVPVRVMINRNAPERPAAMSQAMSHPGAGGTDRLSPVRIESDPFDYRGTGGVLRDLAAQYNDDDLLLVANAAQVLTQPLISLATDLAQTKGDVCLISHLDGTPSNLMLVRCAALRDIQAHGFVDMKEQALPAIAQRFDVTVVNRDTPTGLPVRTLDNYLDALRHHHKAMVGRSANGSAFCEDYSSAFAIIEEGATVGSGARLHDSVILGGGHVEAGAVVVHSVICPGGVVRRGQMTVDQIVAPVNGRAKH